MRLSYQENEAIELQTNKQGIVSTSTKSPAGSKLTALRGQTNGKSVAGPWTIQILDLPEGHQIEDIDDILLMLRYRFEQD